MEMENSSSRSPDSSCPDYFSYATSLGCINRERSSDSISSSTGNSVSSSFGSLFQNNLGNNRSLPIPHDLSKRPENNGRSVINFAAVGRNEDDRLKSTPENSSREQSYLDQWLGSSSVTNNSSGLSSVNYQNSLSSFPDIHNYYKTTTEQVCSSRNPPSYSKPEMPYFASTSNMLRVPKTELSHESSSVSNSTDFLSVAPSTNYANSARQRKKNLSSSQAIAILKAASTSSIQPNSAPYNFMTQQPETSAISSESGHKRKSSPALNNSDSLITASSSSSNYLDSEQNATHPSKKIKAHGSSPPYVELEDIDDDIQILTPVTSKGHTSSASTSSWSRANYHKASVISDGSSTSSLSTPKQPGGALNTLLDSQSSDQTVQERSSAIHKPLSPEELDQMLESVWSDLDEIVSASNVTSAAAPETVTLETLSDGDNSSSSSIVSIHEVQKVNNSLEKDKQPFIKIEKVSTDVPEIIALDASPKTDELQELKASQEVENVKEDFKKLIEDELICNICTEVLIKPITLGCSHTFCKFCIAQWKEKKNQCPMCRAPIKTETPCLFLHNFISKAVEQLDPASVEKRSEIIKTREELQKNKICKPSASVSQPLFAHPHPATLVTRLAPPSFSPYTNFHSLHSNVATRITIPNVIRLTTNINQRPLSQRRDIDIHIRTSSIQRSSNLPQQSSSTPQRTSNFTSSTSNVPQPTSNIFQPTSNIHQPTSNIFQPTSTIPQPTLSIPHRSSSIPQQYSNLQPSSLNGPMSGYFFWN